MTLAWSTIWDRTGAATFRVTVQVAHLGSELRLQLTVPVLPTGGPEQAPVLAPTGLALADTNIAPIGRTSVTVTALAVLGPRFVTLMLYATRGKSW